MYNLNEVSESLQGVLTPVAENLIESVKGLRPVIEAEAADPAASLAILEEAIDAAERILADSGDIDRSNDLAADAADRIIDAVEGIEANPLVEKALRDAYATRDAYALRYKSYEAALVKAEEAARLIFDEAAERLRNRIF